MEDEQHKPVRFLKLADIRKIVADVLRELNMDGDTNILARVVDYELKIQELTQQVETLKKAQQSSSNEEVEHLKQQLEELTKNYHILYGYYERLQKENEALRKKLASVSSESSQNQDIVNLQKELQLAKAEARSYRKKLDDAKRLLEQTRSIYSATIKELENRVKTLEKQLAQHDNKNE
ncbi:MAG: hypothetical protein DRP82_00165 [Planctomycetota bacterium]|nr:MAG: hypothetical protein DRP82_00165 [Planctomycetota bacterium]